MRRVKVFQFVADPGHGWLRVPRCMLHELGIERRVSTCSYQIRENSEFVWLEEDCDASLFFNMYVEKYGDRPVIKYRHTNRDAAMRRYLRYACSLEEVIKCGK